MICSIQNRKRLPRNRQFKIVELKTNDLSNNILEEAKGYFNETITNWNTVLFGKVKTLKTNNFKYIWYKNGKLFVRRTEHDKAVIL